MKMEDRTDGLLDERTDKWSEGSMDERYIDR